MDTVKGSGVHTPESDSGSDVDIMTYSDNDEDFQTVVWGRREEARSNRDEEPSIVNVCNGSMSCTVETDHRTSGATNEKQQFKASSREVDLLRGIGNGVSLDYPSEKEHGVGDDGIWSGTKDEISIGNDLQEKQNIVGGDDTSGSEDEVLFGDDPSVKQDSMRDDHPSGSEDEGSLGNDVSEKQNFMEDDGFSGSDDEVSVDDPPEKQSNLICSKDNPDVDAPRYCFDTKVSGNESKQAASESASESASEWSPTSDNSDFEDQMSNDNVSTKSHVSEELDVDGISSEDEDGLDYGRKDGSEEEIQRDSFLREGELSRTVENGTSEDINQSAFKSTTFEKALPYQYNTTFAGSLVNMKSRVKNCKVFLGRLPSFVENCQNDVSIKSDFSKEPDAGGINAQNEDDHECPGRENDIQQDSITEKDNLSQTGEHGISKDTKKLSARSTTSQNLSPHPYKTTVGGSPMYTKSHVTDGKVVVGRLPAAGENCHVGAERIGGVGENFSVGNLSNCEQAEPETNAQSAVSGNLCSDSDFNNSSSASTSSKPKSHSFLSETLPEIDDPTYCPPRSISKDVYDYFKKRDGRFVCKICGVEYGQRRKLKPHINVHTGKYKCRKCGKALKSKKYYKAHLLKHPDDSRFMFVCEICGKGFTQASNRKTHMALVHSHERNFACNICGSRWKRRCDLRIHMRRVHEGITPKTIKPAAGRKRYPCPVCGGMFTELHTHMRKHTGEKPYQCNICERRFAAANTLVAHQRTHTGERPFKCTQCDKTFTQSSHRSTHMKSVHLTERGYKCETCGKSFKLKSHLNMHKEIHADNWLSFICQICGIGCRSKRLLKSHMLIHEVEKRFECTDCGLKFRHPGTYRTHMKVHRQEWVHKCAICGAGYVRKDVYLSHMKKHRKRPHNKSS